MLFSPDVTAVIVAVILAVMAGGIIGIVIRYNRPQQKLKRRWARIEKEKAEEAKRLKKMEDLKKEVTDKPPPPTPTPVLAALPTALEEESIGEFVNFEIGKEKKGKRVTVVRGRLRVRPDRFGRLRDKFLFQWDKGAYYVDLNKLIEVEVKKGFRGKAIEIVRRLVYDIVSSEPMNQDGTVEWDDNLESILTDAGAGQYIDAASAEGGFALTPALIRALIVIGLLGTFLGLALNGTAHFTPTTIVHWIP